MRLEISWENFQELDAELEFNWDVYGLSRRNFKRGRGWDSDQVSPEDTCEINLMNIDPSELKVLKTALFAMKSKMPRGAKSMLTKYIAIQKGKTIRASGAKQMQFLMMNFIALHADRFWLKKMSNGQTYFYLVEYVRFHDKHVSRNGTRPACIEIETQYTYGGSSKSRDFEFENNQCRGKTPEQLLAEAGLSVANKEECEAHDVEFQRYCELAVQIGRQVTSVGIGKGESRETGTKNLGANGQVSILVIDVADDGDEDDSNMYNCENRYEYLPHSLYEIRDRVRDNKVIDLDDEDFEEEESRYIQSPVHPWIDCFDLRRHARFEVHVSDLKEYIYDPHLDQKLVIDSEVKELIGLLARSQDGKFKDVVAGKTGGTTVLLAGPPGVGKTLTAEIFSETVEKPLYRVQCSQLGTDPDELEQKLLKVFRRAARWKAIILLDESDVYVAKRGDCLAKNAIVGVFLRVLEYQESVMFMTTNLPESVDDAIASRCIARIDYSIPTPEDLNKIWDVLSSNAGMELDWAVRSQITNEFPHLSGRDVKNILKLIAARNQPVDLASVKQAAKFHPNRGNWRDQGWQ